MAPPRRGRANQKYKQNDNFATKKRVQDGKSQPTNATPIQDNNKTGEPTAGTPADYQFTYEVMWCLQSMDALKTAPKTTEKQAADIRKAMKALLNDKTPMIKKRQLMRSYCGDYRVKMAEDERRQRAVKASIATNPSLPKASQFHRAALRSSSRGNAATLAESVDHLSLGAVVDAAPVPIQSQNSTDVNAPRTSTVLSTLFKNKSNSSFMFNFNLVEND